MKTLLTAFCPFGGDKINPAEEAARGVKTPDTQLIILPVEYETASRIAIREIERFKPELVICLGQAGGRTGVTPETTAVNLRSALSPDNAGRVCESEIIDPLAPERLMSSFDAAKIAERISAGGIPSYISDGAGTYVCNDVMFCVLNHLKNTFVKAGFIHLPFCDEQKQAHPGAFTLSIETLTRAIEIAIETVRNEYDT